MAASLMPEEPMDTEEASEGDGKRSPLEGDGYSNFILSIFVLYPI